MVLIYWRKKQRGLRKGKKKVRIVFLGIVIGFKSEVKVLSSTFWESPYGMISS